MTTETKVDDITMKTTTSRKQAFDKEKKTYFFARYDH